MIMKIRRGNGYPERLGSNGIEFEKNEIEWNGWLSGMFS